MAKKKKGSQPKSPPTLLPGLSLGNNSAEADDDYLFECFVRTPAYAELTSFESPKMIAAGRTGAGKTAILRNIARENPRIAEIDPFDISLGFISNSDILNFLHAAGADLDLLFQVLWKHVLCVEYARLRYSVRDASKWTTVFSNIQSVFGGDPRRKKALDYLRNFDGKFWIPFDENVKEVVEKITKQLEAEFATDFEKLRSKVNYERGLSSEKRAEIIQRCRKIVTPDQLRELSQLIDLLADDGQHQGKYFILIDKLDENWIEDPLRFRMIRALIETLKGFIKIRRLKLVVALRSDVLERVMQETRELGFQKEKYEDYICDLRWTRAQLREFIEGRIKLLARRAYNGQPLKLDELFPRKVGHREPFEYMLERTLNRPRDVLSYFNLCFKNASNKPEVTAAVIRESEREYSIGRYGALIDEWKGAFPQLAIILSFAAEVGSTSTINDLLAPQRSDDLILRISAESTLQGLPIHEAAERVLATGEDADLVRLIRLTIEVLYRVGAVGVKPAYSDRFLYSHLDMPLLSPGLVTDKTPIRIHPMLVRALNVSDAAMRMSTAA